MAEEGEILPVVPEDDKQIQAAVEAVVADLPDDPYERAQRRLVRLKSTFASTLAVVAEMYRDEDWRYLQREDGTGYATMAELIADVMQVSLPMARRYVQGGRDFYLPLSELTLEGTRIEITSGDVAKLGSAGLSDAVSTAKERLEGVEDPQEASGIIDDSIQQAHQKRDAQRKADEDQWGDSVAQQEFEGYDPGPTGGGDDLSGLPSGDETGGWGDGEIDATTPATPPATVPAGGGDAPGGGDWSGLGGEDEFEDPAARLLEGAQDYSDPSVRKGLAQPLQDIAAALVVLKDMNPEEVSQQVTYETRGVLLSAEEALNAVVRLRSLVETRPWFISRLTDGEG